MSRNPPRLPRPFAPHRSLRRPPEPGISGPCSGRSNKASCRARYWSSSTSARSRDVKTEVSRNRTDHYTPLAYQPQVAKGRSGKRTVKRKSAETGLIHWDLLGRLTAADECRKRSQLLVASVIGDRLDVPIPLEAREE